MPDETRKPDAILFHESIKRGVGVIARGLDMQGRLSLILGGGAIYMSSTDGGWWFARLNPQDTLLFAKDHPRTGESRYDWADVEPGLKYGYRVAE